MEEAETALEKPFLVMNEEDVTIENIELDELAGEINRTEITLYYINQDLPAFTLSVFPTPEEAGMELASSDLQVRGQNAEYMKEIKALAWDEDGLRYNIIISHPDLEIEDVLKMTENMKLSSME